MTTPQDPGPALLALQQEWQQRHAALWQAMLRRRKDAPPPAPLVAPEPGDRRFNHPAWAESPVYDWLRQAYLLNAHYLKRIADTMPIPQQLPRKRVQFAMRQFVDALAPSNFAATNPEFIGKALETGGESIRQGVQNLIADLGKGRISMTDESAFEVGRNLGITPGAVVFENELIQLLQYAPLTDTVARRPLLVAVTVLTSMSAEDLREVGVAGAPADQVLRLARLARSCQLDGVVCSAQEAALLRAELGADFRLVTPGIRPAGSDAGDQRRVMTPAEALRAGATDLVIGRPVTGAPEPLAALQAIQAEIRNA